MEKARRLCSAMLRELSQSLQGSHSHTSRPDQQPQADPPHPPPPHAPHASYFDTPLTCNLG